MGVQLFQQLCSTKDRQLYFNVKIQEHKGMGVLKK